jgi:hypothetical protein
MSCVDRYPEEHAAVIKCQEELNSLRSSGAIATFVLGNLLAWNRTPAPRFQHAFGSPMAAFRFGTRYVTHFIHIPFGCVNEVMR